MISQSSVTGITAMIFNHGLCRCNLHISHHHLLLLSLLHTNLLSNVISIFSELHLESVCCIRLRFITLCAQSDTAGGSTVANSPPRPAGGGGTKFATAGKSTVANPSVTTAEKSTVPTSGEKTRANRGSVSAAYDENGEPIKRSAASPTGMNRICNKLKK